MFLPYWCSTSRISFEKVVVFEHVETVFSSEELMFDMHAFSRPSGTEIISFSRAPKAEALGYSRIVPAGFLTELNSLAHQILMALTGGRVHSEEGLTRRNLRES